MHSRAARRASSPSLNLDKTLRRVKAPVLSSEARPSILAARADAGILKKGKKVRAASSKKRRRQEKGAERALAVIEKTKRKVAKSEGRVKMVKERRVCL